MDLYNFNIKNNVKNDKIKGAIYGSIIGDIEGLLYEGVKPKYINKDKILTKNFYNMYSDDTEHLLIILKSLFETSDVSSFNNKFIFELRKWLFTLPYGIGKATLKSIIKSFFTSKSGVVSQGNGALMRLGVLGLFLNGDTLQIYVKNNCILTHNSSESLNTSLMFAKIVNHLLNEEYNEEKIFNIIGNYNFKEWTVFVEDIKECLKNKIEVTEVSKKWTGSYGAYGYTLVTFALSLYTFLLNKDNYEKGLKEIISCGGDTDTNAFVYGMLSGVYNGFDNIPIKYIDIVNKKLNINDLLDLINHKNQKYKITYIKLLIRNIFVIPLIFIEIIKRYLLFIINKKI